jgi:hypothetical protein
LLGRSLQLFEDRPEVGGDPAGLSAPALMSKTGLCHDLTPWHIDTRGAGKR